MPSIPIIMPQLGESIAEATIINFLVQPGEEVHTDQDIIEVETNKATMNVTSPCRGRIEKFIANLEQHKQSQASTMRVAVADAMRRSWSRPLATVALPVCFDPLLKHRKTCDPKPGPALYALRALAVALAEDSAPAGRLVG